MIEAEDGDAIGYLSADPIELNELLDAVRVVGMPESLEIDRTFVNVASEFNETVAAIT